MLRLLLANQTGESTAAALGISRRMVQRYIASICEKCGVQGKYDVVTMFRIFSIEQAAYGGASNE